MNLRKRYINSVGRAHKNTFISISNLLHKYLSWSRDGADVPDNTKLDGVWYRRSLSVALTIALRVHQRQ